MVFTVVARIIVLFTALPVHECAHGLVSYWQGDPTAKQQGRISLNPLRHFDMMGTLCIMLVGFGWAKPVPVDSRYYKNRKLGMAITALAGPLSNILMALILMAGLKLALLYLPIATEVAAFAIEVVYMMVIINVGLAIYNMLPVPPFDGSRIFLFFLPERWYFGVMKYERYLMLAVIALVWFGILDTPLTFLRSNTLYALDFLTGFLGRLYG